MSGPFVCRSVKVSSHIFLGRGHAPQEAIASAMLGLVNPGDEVVLFDPVGAPPGRGGAERWVAH